MTVETRTFLMTVFTYLEKDCTMLVSPWQAEAESLYLIHTVQCQRAPRGYQSEAMSREINFATKERKRVGRKSTNRQQRVELALLSPPVGHKGFGGR